MKSSPSNPRIFLASAAINLTFSTGTPVVLETMLGEATARNLRL